MKKSVLIFVLLVLAACAAWGVLHLRITENLNNTLPGNAYFEELEPFLEKGKRSIIFSVDVEKLNGDTFRIDSLGATFAAEIDENFAAEIAPLQYQSDVDADAFSNFIHDNLFLFLAESDYKKMEKAMQPDSIKSALEANLRTLSSLQSVGGMQQMMRDPLHFDKLGFAKLSAATDVDELMRTQGLYLSRDGQKLLLHSALNFDPQDVEKTQNLKNALATFTANWNTKNAAFTTDHFGSFLITEANAGQIKKDIILTVNLALLFIVGLLLVYYRNFLTLVFFVLPGAVGIGMALFFMAIFQGGISALALSAGAVIMGIVVDYSFHYFSHYHQLKNAVAARNKIWFPLLISSLTTVVAFLALAFANSQALRDFGIFTALSLLFTLAFILLVLPHILQWRKSKPKDENQSRQTPMHKLVGWLESIKPKHSKWAVLAVFVGTIVLAFFAGDVQFEDDLNKINFYPESLKQREIAHQNIDPDVEKRITAVAFGADENEAAANNRKLFEKLNQPEWSEKIKMLNSLGAFVFSENEAQQKAEKWRQFWESRREPFLNNFAAAATDVGFQWQGFAPFISSISVPKDAVNSLAFARQFKSFDALVVQEKNTNLLSSVVVPKENLDEVKAAISAQSGVFVIDGAGVAAAMVETIKADFNLLLLIASITVFVVMLLVYGRIELTLISFLPMAISWIWILGLASIFGIKFNFINIIIATIIFGLGDDFAIFVTDGLVERLKYKTKGLATHQAGILLSSVSTIVGTGVLFFAQHPAIRSIAAVSVLGIAIIALNSFVVQPFLFRVLILNRTEKGKSPRTLLEFVLSVYAFSLFFVGSIFISVVTAVVLLIPFLPKRYKKMTVHRLIQFFTGILINTMGLVRKRYFDMHHLDFSRPSVIIANHTSFLDILLLAMRHPKLVIMVGPWVYNSPIFGWFIRYADYLPAFEPIEQNIEKLRKLVNDGFSVVVFPEGHRSPDGKMRRFHKGAFYISEQLQIDITPVLLHGVHYTLPKGDFYVKSSFLNFKVLPRIAWDDPRFGEGYRARAKAITKYYKKAHAAFSDERENAAYLQYPLQFSYLYKGPVLEWYFRIKYRFESPVYGVVDRAVGDRKSIVDLGCGYGFLSYYLQQRNAQREIAGRDFDEEKINVARASHLKTASMHFAHADIAEMEMPPADAFLLMDVLHYLPAAKQQKVLENCAKNLNENGVILLKDGLADDAEKHAWTEKSERWSTRWIKFNKTQNKLHFFTKSWLENWAQTHGLQTEVLHASEKSSNALVMIYKH